MGKYAKFLGCYGTTATSKALYWQKMGLAQGIKNTISWKLGFDKKYLSKEEEINGKIYVTTSILALIPTSEYDIHNGNVPVFIYGERYFVVDMIKINSEVMFHGVFVEIKEKNFVFSESYGWRTIRERMTIEETATLFDYINSRLSDLVFVPVSEQDNEHNGILKQI